MTDRTASARGLQALAARQWPLVISVALLLAVVLLLAGRVCRDREGYLVYALDDAYIHMAIAKNLAHHGVWGPTRYEFGNASSSPLWTLMLAAGFALAEDPRSLPLVLNVICAVLFLWLAHGALLRVGVPAGYRTAALVLAVLLVPLPVLIFVGMEHTLHLLMSAAFCYCIALALRSEKPSSRALRGAFILAALLPMVRFEGLFAVAVAAGLLFATARRRQAVGLVIAAAAPVLAFGLIAVACGADILPNSVLVKAAPDVHSLMGWAKSLGRGCWSLAGTPVLATSLTVISLLLVCDRRLDRLQWSVGGLLSLQFVLIAALHLQVARVGWFYRYEAYLVGMALVAAAIHCRELLACGLLAWPRGLIRKLAAVGLVIAILVPLGMRMKTSAEITKASWDIYRQQYQMALFAQRYYSGKTVALNDIGAVCYYADIRLIDLWGLATTEVARLKRAGKFRRGQIKRICEKARVDLVMAYPDWYDEFGGLPRAWLPVGEITMKQRTVAGGTHVEVYVLEAEQADAARRHLAEFSQQVPKGAVVRVIEPGENAPNEQGEADAP